MALDIELSLVTILIGHATYVLPFAFFVIAAQQYGFDRTLEEAAMDLGADRLRTFRSVTLPLMIPGLAAAESSPSRFRSTSSFITFC
jgi:spermidine/putrescine transport system permease protein